MVRFLSSAFLTRSLAIHHLCNICLKPQFFLGFGPRGGQVCRGPFWERHRKLSIVFVHRPFQKVNISLAQMRLYPQLERKCCFDSLTCLALENNQSKNKTNKEIGENQEQRQQQQQMQTQATATTTKAKMATRLEINNTKQQDNNKKKKKKEQPKRRKKTTKKKYNNNNEKTQRFVDMSPTCLFSGTKWDNLLLLEWRRTEN